MGRLRLGGRPTLEVMREVDCTEWYSKPAVVSEIEPHCVISLTGRRLGGY